MKVIYEPKGRAKEYSPLALNIYNGCVFGCAYCYVPKFTHKVKSEFHSKAEPRKNFMDKLIRDLKELEETRDDRQILLSFTSDPYPPVEQELRITRTILQLMDEHGLNYTVLTKNGKLATRDFDYMTYFGSTIIFSSDGEEYRKKWEMNAPPIRERIEAVREAHSQGIRTWVSLEPVIVPEEAIAVIRELADDVDYWKVGKLNHYPEIERSVDWKAFHQNLMDTFEELGIEEDKYYIKEDLKDAVKRGK